MLFFITSRWILVAMFCSYSFLFKLNYLCLNLLKLWKFVSQKADLSSFYKTHQGGGGGAIYAPWCTSLTILGWYVCPISIRLNWNCYTFLCEILGCPSTEVYIPHKVPSNCLTYSHAISYGADISFPIIYIPILKPYFSCWSSNNNDHKIYSSKQEMVSANAVKSWCTYTKSCSWNVCSR